MTASRPGLTARFAFSTLDRQPHQPGQRPKESTVNKENLQHALTCIHQAEDHLRAMLDILNNTDKPKPLPFIGNRIRLGFAPAVGNTLLPAGLTGTVINYVDDDPDVQYIVHLDADQPELAEWDNCVHVHPDQARDWQPTDVDPVDMPGRVFRQLAAECMGVQQRHIVGTLADAYAKIVVANIGVGTWWTAIKSDKSIHDLADTGDFLVRAMEACDYPYIAACTECAEIMTSAQDHAEAMRFFI
jgi:hypothetical protein